MANVDAEGKAVVRLAGDALPAKRDIRELKGLLKRPGRRPVTLREMDAAIARHHGARS